MKCLSLMQPWASLIALGQKKIETRSWKTNYRGELYIHASQKTDKKICKNNIYKNVLEDVQLPNSQIIAKCNLVDCIKMTKEFIQKIKESGNEYYFGGYSEGRYAWILEDAEILDKPIEAKGKLGIWGHEDEEI